MPVAIREPVKEALLVGISYTTNENLLQNRFPLQPGAYEDTRILKNLLTST